MRYDKFGVLYEANGLLPNAVGGQAGAFGISGTDWNALWNPGANAGSLTQLQVVGKHSPHPQPFYPNDWTNFAPSVGFSYKIPWLTRTTVVRGGYGVYIVPEFSTGTNTGGTNQLQWLGPFALNATYNNVNNSDPSRGAQPLFSWLPLGLLVLKAGIKRSADDIEREAVQLVRDRIGPVASFKTALVVAGLPKTRSGKILRGTMRRIADGELYPMPATIDDPAVLGEINAALANAGYGKRDRV